MLRNKLMKMLEDRQEEMIEIRRHLHLYPELSFQEKKTSEYIYNFYKNKDVKINKNVNGSNGLLVTIEGKQKGDTIALRADFDALPIHEQTGLNFKSKNEGVFHGCGHDGHTAYLMILADCLIQIKDELKGTIKIIHQHAEEIPPGGAQDFLKSGLLKDVKEIYGIHFMPFGKPGDVFYHPKLTMNGRNIFNLTIKGTAGHGSSPHNANDAIIAASYFITSLQTVISRRLNPFDEGVVSVGSFDGKGQFNIIQDTVKLAGDVRYIKKEISELIGKEIETIAKGIKTMFKVDIEFEYINDYPTLYNDPDITKKAIKVLKNKDYINNILDSGEISASEDFAYYLQKIPGIFLFIGATPHGMKQGYFNHHPKFDINEDSLLIAAKTIGDLVLNYYNLD